MTARKGSAGVAEVVAADALALADLAQFGDGFADGLAVVTELVVLAQRAAFPPPVRGVCHRPSIDPVGWMRLPLGRYQCTFPAPIHAFPSCPAPASPVEALRNWLPTRSTATGRRGACCLGAPNGDDLRYSGG